MKTNKKSKLLRFVAILLSVLMLGTAFATLVPFMVNAADESGDTLQYPISDYNPGVTCYEPIPMLVIMINFDADGDGVDDNPDGTGYSAVKNSANAEYGEQWCHTTEEDWTARLFSEEGNTLNTYYKYMSNDKFWWIPANETYGTANNGIIAVTIDEVHPDCNGVSENWFHCFHKTMEAADEYVDFSQYDTNGNGRIDKYELCLAFILGGAETSSGSTNMTEVYGFHAYYRDYKTDAVTTLDGVEVGRSGFFGTGAISGGHALNFGVFAHELGHYLGAPDLYDTDSKGPESYTNAVGALSMMASGAHGSTPSHFDPYILSTFGFYTPTAVLADGTYTLYSKASDEGEYNILKICTPNPGEYYLIENRYSSIVDGSTFDSGAQKGILIWHVDENIHKKTGMTANTQSKGCDPTLVAYPPIGKETTTGINPVGIVSSPFTIDNIMTPNYAKFNPTAYKFPVSETWYTSMSAEEAALVENLRVEVISTKGDEIQVKISGVYTPELKPEWTLSDTNVTQTSFTLNGYLSTLDYTTLNSAKIQLVDASTKEVVKEDDIVLSSDYKFTVDYTGLAPNKNYIAKIVSNVTRFNGTADENATTEFEKDFYTLSDAVKTKATVTINMNSDIKASTTAKIKVGDVVTVSANFLTKKGYKLEGWYLDEEFTQRYDFAPLETVDDFAIYAKWVEEAKAATLSVVGAEVSGTLYAAEVGGTFTSPVPEEKAGYTFGGWYADADCTLEFDFTQAVSSAGDVRIYAKWVSESGEVVTPNNSTAETVPPDNTTAAPTEPGDNTQDENKGGLSTGAIVGIIIVCVAAVGGVVAVSIALAKKKKK